MSDARKQEHMSDSYATGPVMDTFEERRQDYIAYVLQKPILDNNRSIWHELICMLGGVRVAEDPIFESLNFINERNDCADFAVHTVLRLVYQFDPGRKEPTPNGKAFTLKFPPSQKVLAAAKETILNFKYWPDEPGIDSMCSWTENHYILFSAAAYLAGQLYPDEIFSNSGETGLEKMARNRPRILRWLAMRYKSGFSEWLSNVYYEEDIGALMSLVDLCLDDEIREKATKIIDLILLDMVLNQFKGVFGATHGRSYENNKKWAHLDSSATTMKLLFGQGIYTKTGSMGASPFVVSNYQIPPVLHEIFQDQQVSIVNRQRCGFLIQDQEKWGWDYDSLEDGMLFFTNEGYLHPSAAATTIKMLDAFNWWENAFFSDFKPFKGFLKAIAKLKLTKPTARLLERDTCRNMRDEANLYTYKTP
ncbi:MAG: hypothetical protein IAF02_23395, partial [Anaerolineae bacterium]|nr:hypothetical protein [Anaerolineae bacterium]